MTGALPLLWLGQAGSPRRPPAGVAPRGKR